MWLLLCVLVIIALAYLFTKYVVGRGGLGGVGLSGRSERFQVLARLSLGREQSAALVKAGEKYLLLGVAPTGVTLLKELTREEAEAVCPPTSGDQPAPPSFGEALRTAFKQRKPR